MMTAQNEPAWMQPCRDELYELDPLLLAVFDIRWNQFSGDCTATQIHRHMQGEKLKWTPCNRATVHRWLKRVLTVEERYRIA